MKYLFQLNHPAHYHLFKNTIIKLKEKGNNVDILARRKDILENLLVGENHTLLSVNKGSNLLEKLNNNARSNHEILEYCKKGNYDMIIGTGTFGFVTKKTNITSIFLGEDDLTTNIVLLLSGLFIYRDFSAILSPKGVNNSIWNKKTIFYEGYQKLAYLHPNQFVPEKKIVEKYFPTDSQYFIIRFAKLNAYHDFNVQGINSIVAQKLIDILEPYGNVYITSERELEPQFEKYRLKINPLDIHHVLTFASLYIGDSQSMAVEAAMLGVPSIRFNDFAGKISVLEELEHKYGLTYGIKTDHPERLFEKINELLAIQNLREEFQFRRRKMLADKIDVTAFLVWFIENYPKSKEIMKTNPDYQYRFK